VKKILLVVEQNLSSTKHIEHRWRKKRCNLLS